MNTAQINNGLSIQAERNNTLEFLQDNQSNVDESVIAHLISIIDDPGSIDDTNSFATLLVNLNAEDFIPSLIAVIQRGAPDESRWFADYMYALIELLEDLSDYYPVDDSFAKLLGGWLLSTGGGEISWKSSGILSNIKNENTRDYFFKAAVDESLFHMTRINCLREIVNHYLEDANELITILTNDSNANVREAARDAQAHLTKMQDHQVQAAGDPPELDP